MQTVRAYHTLEYNKKIGQVASLRFPTRNPRKKFDVIIFAYVAAIIGDRQFGCNSRRVATQSDTYTLKTIEFRLYTLSAFRNGGACLPWQDYFLLVDPFSSDSAVVLPEEATPFLRQYMIHKKQQCIINRVKTTIMLCRVQ